MTADCLDGLHELAKNGWRLLPVFQTDGLRCACGHAKCRKPGKHPRLKDWTCKASSDLNQINEWHRKWPTGNWGLATGKESGIIVLDFDGDNGKATFDRMIRDLRDTRIHRTGTGGFHVFFTHPGGTIGNRVRILPGLDIRADGGMVVIPPSIHASGRRYESANEAEILPLPETIRLLLAKGDYAYATDGHTSTDTTYASLPTSNPTVSTPQCHKERQGVITSNDESQCETKQVVGVGGDLERLKKQLEWALTASLPTEKGIRHRQVFQLARYLLTVDGITQKTDARRLRPIVMRWHTMAIEQASRIGFTINGDAEETWSDFQFAWKRVKYPIGSEVLQRIFDHVVEMDDGSEVQPIVWNALVYFDRTNDRDMRILTAVLYELSKCCEPEPFRLACHAGATQFNRLGCDRDHKWLYRRLKSMVVDGILSCVDPGQAGVSKDRRAAQYRWIWEPQEKPPDDLETLLNGL